MESLFPPEDNKIRPPTRFPSNAAQQTRTPDPPRSPCEPGRNHDYVNIQPIVSQQRYYENVGPVLENPGVRRAREKYIADMQKAAATDSVYANG